MKYDPHLIEKKWQDRWLADKTYKATEDSKKEKYYVLDMFPYPSGAGLHVGHLVGYTATDVIARYKWAKGFSVLHPMGWDSFGLPAEQYAIRTGTHPKVTTLSNIKNFKKQLQAVGYAYDWDREILTSEPSYYKWTQWIFTKLYEKGLAYEAEMLVNYCPALSTVLANEEIEEGRSKEGGHPIERRPLRQWVLKITEYADRLLADLEDLDWPEGLKKLQRNWIGRSVGVEICFPIEGRDECVEIYTREHDTIFGVTYVVLSPEHPLVEKVTTAEHIEGVAQYKREVAAKSDLERTELAKEKSGVFTGSYVINPVNGAHVPIWIGDYVLMGYGTGAVMGVPAHDERDEQFVGKYGLDSIVVIDEGRMVRSSNETLALDGLSPKEAKERVAHWLEESKNGRRKVNFRLRDWLFSRQRYWGEPFPILHFEDGSMRPLELDELPLTPPEVTEYKPADTGESPLAKERDWVEVIDSKTGKKALRETNTMPQWAGSCWYYLRFCDARNEQAAWGLEKEKYWMPVDLYVGGAEHAVLHLLYSRFWHKVLFDCGLVSSKEPFKKLCNQGLVVARAFQRKGGGYVSTDEVVEKEGNYTHWESGEELTSGIEKMSKSKLNGVSPDEVIEEFGSDAMRLYSMFMGPIDKEKVWKNHAVSGCRRFLNRFFELATSEKVVECDEGIALAHRLVDGVAQDLEKLLFNTAISKMMEFLNEATRLDRLSKEAMTIAVQVLAPFAPHIAEELWAHLGGEESVVKAPWPSVDPNYLVDEKVTYVVQVNGKLRGRFELPIDKSKEEILALAKEEGNVAKHLHGEIIKVIFVPNKLLNIVVK
ncbi:MAG: Leucine--tRNA ligase [Chlamydiales bacterium]|nr:Leucine--tRNA ligase [Chlamydiales bacterium]MCH9620100.1 Leucine--tRNA ligase [Chlamydiales bacterium]MCH9623570.1 Leucine--tRNA ligase [Chlamydiales bacterium]